MENTLIRSEPCPQCGEEMLWTQNAWRSNDVASAAYQCVNGHVLDPDTTRQCLTVACTIRRGPVAQPANRSTAVCGAGLYSTCRDEGTSAKPLV
jgi:hypothetical protein